MCIHNENGITSCGCCDQCLELMIEIFKDYEQQVKKLKQELREVKANMHQPE